MAAKFVKGDRILFLGDPASGDKAKGTVMQFISGTFNKYEVRTDLGSVLYFGEDELEPLKAKKSND
jgi:hypothetical protein